MNPQTAVAVAVVGALVGWGVWYLARAFRVWRALRGDRVVTCPETGAPAAVKFDIARAVTRDSGATEGVPLQDCSRWSERGPCEQPCAVAAQAPESSASAMAHSWAHEKTCVSCGAWLLGSEKMGHHFALRDSDGTTCQWVDIAAERLSAALANRQPMCWNCHIAETFRRQHPELVTDREDAAVHVQH